MLGIIYKVVSPSGKVYIGQTIQSLNKRKAAHFSEAFNMNGRYLNKKFSRAIRKYKNDLLWQVLCEVSVKKMNELEIKYIRKYDSYINGYNCTIGGQDSTLGLKHTKETKKKMSLKRKGYEHSDETKKKISEALKGKKLSDERKNKISKSLKGFKHSELTKRKMIQTRTGCVRAKYTLVTPKNQSILLNGLRGLKEYCDSVEINFDSIVSHKKVGQYTLERSNK